MNRGFLKWFGRQINTHVHFIFLSMSSHIHEVKYSLTQIVYFSKTISQPQRKVVFGSPFGPQLVFPLGSDALSDYLCEAIPGCWVGYKTPFAPFVYKLF